MSEHKHLHEESCGCGCEPEQEHEHHEDTCCDDDCCCGHDHEHEHEHDDDCCDDDCCDDDCCDDDCCCGHDHDHEHEHDDDCCDDDCCCGHDHDHEHEHEHDDDCCDDDCCCGHDHEHEHEYDDDCCDDDCCCGHDHEHEHEHNHHHEHHHHHHEQEHAANADVYILENLGCAHCAAKMEEKINHLPGVTAATITYATKQLRLTAKNADSLLPEIQKICASIESEVKVVPRDAAPTKKTDADSTPHKEVDEDSKDLTVIIIGAILFVAGICCNRLGANSILTIVVFLAAYLVLGGEILLEAAKNIGHGQIFDENFLMSIATIGALAIREYPEAVGVMLFYRIGEFFEHKAVERSRSQIMDAVDMRPETVNLILNDTVTTIPAGEAKVGDILLIRPGDRIPLDGVIVEGNSRLDTSAITGEPVPVTVDCGDSILSGCVNESGQLKLRVEKPLSESMVTRILNSVENAAASKPKIDRFITRFAKIYTPCVVLIAAATAILPSLVSGNWTYWIYTALTFLVMSCPCALVLSVPLAFFSGIGAGSKKGILFKGGLSIESLNNIGAVVMDKTGTITEGNFKLQQIVSTGNFSEEELLTMCAACEQTSTHPIAASIVAAAKERHLTLPHPDALEEISGHGIKASLASDTILCGNRALMDRYQIELPKLPDDLYGSEVFLAVNDAFAGYMVISDTIKQDAKSAIARLNALGLHTVMLTGDSKSSAEAVASETGIKEVYAKLLPEQKLEKLPEIRAQHGGVLFVGDGINDAPVLAGADVGAAMGSGADAAIEAADVVFMTSSVEAIAQSVSIARGTNRIAIQNVVFALVVKIAVMILGLTGHANMWMAVFADTGVAMICVLNSIRALYFHK